MKLLVLFRIAKTAFSHKVLSGVRILLVPTVCTYNFVFSNCSYVVFNFLIIFYLKKNNN
jgi:hypothetical protein